MARKIKLKELHTTGSTPPNELKYGEIGITHGNFVFVDENKIKYEEIKCGPRIYTCVDDDLEKNKKITYITEWEIENTLSGLSSQIAGPSNYGFATLYSGNTEDICNYLKNNGVTSNINASTTFYIKPSKNISDYYQLSNYLPIRKFYNIAQISLKINGEKIESNSDSKLDNLYFDIESLNDKVFIGQKSAKEVLNNEYVIADDYKYKPLKFTLKKYGDNTILDEIIIDSVYNPTILGGLNIVSSNNCLVVPVNDSSETVSDIEYNFQIRVYKFGELCQFKLKSEIEAPEGFDITYGFNENSESGGVLNVKITIPSGTYVHLGWHDFNIEIKTADDDGNYNIFRNAVTSVYHNHDRIYVDTTKTGYKNFINDVNKTLVNDESTFNNFYNITSTSAYTLADILINITDEIPILYKKLGAFAVDADDVSISEGSGKDPILKLTSTLENENNIEKIGQKLEISHDRRNNIDYSYKINGEEDSIFNTNSSNTFNNIITLPLDKNGHLVGEYVNILTANVSGITFEFVDENYEPIEDSEFFLKDKYIRLKYTIQPEYNATLPKFEPAVSKEEGITSWIENGYTHKIVGFIPNDNTKIFITATTIDASGKTITFKDNKLIDKEFKNYYYETIEYKFRGAAKDKIGCVYMPPGIQYDNENIPPQPACANKYHKHSDYFYIDRNENYESGYTITGINLINCSSY